MTDPASSTDSDASDDELARVFQNARGRRLISRAIELEVLQKQPGLREALWHDVRAYSKMLMEEPLPMTRFSALRDIVRFSWTTDAFLCLLLYRLRTRLRVWRVPILPRILHRLCVVIAQLSIGDLVILKPGVYFPHGLVVIDGIVEVGQGTSIAPWVTLGRAGLPLHGPTIAENVLIGTGAKILGPIKVGLNAKVAADSVVIEDVAPYTTVAGNPAQLVADRRDHPDFQNLKEAIIKKRAERAAAKDGE